MAMPDYPIVTADELGDARCYDGYAKSDPRDAQREMHFSVKLRDPTGRFPHGPRGWLTRNEASDRFTNLLIQDNRDNQNVEFIEWPDRFNCVVNDGVYISHAHFYMSKPEFMDRAKHDTPTKP